MSQSTARLRTLYPFLHHHHHHRTITTVVHSANKTARYAPISPHASSKPTSVQSSTFSPSNSIPSHSLPRQRTFSPNKSTPPPRYPTPPNTPSSETPAEKVARLRAARQAAKNVPIPLWDRVVVSGRYWADVLHRITVLLIIAFSIVAGGVTLSSLGRMIYINRLKRDAFYADERLKHDNALLNAVESARAGVVLSEQQMMLLDDERFRLEEKERKKRDGWGIQKFFFGGGLKSFLLAGLDKGDGRKTEIFVRPKVEGEDEEGEGEAVTDSAQELRMEGKNAVENNMGEGSTAVGGPLDQMAEKATELAKPKGGWGSWWGGK